MCEECGSPNIESAGDGRLPSRRTILKIAGAGAAMWMMPTGANAASAQDSTDAADLIFFNGRIINDAANASGARAIAVRSNRVMAIGSIGEVMRHRGRKTQTWNLNGKTVIPGLNDSHLHQFFAALNRPQVSLLEARSIADLVAAIGDRVSGRPGGEWVLARSGWHESLLDEGRLPTRHDLDPVSPENPVYIPRGGHVAAVNSAALAIAGITRATPDPNGGVIVRDGSGEPTGVLLERAKDLVTPHLPPPPPPSEQKALLREQMLEHNSLGITSVTEPGLSASQFDMYSDLWGEGQLTTRAHLLWRVRSLSDVDAAMAAFQPQSGDDMLRLDGLKYGADGGVEGASLKEPYEIVPGEQEDPNYRGLMFLPPGGVDELVEMYVRAADHGFQVQTHIVGDATFEVIIGALQDANARTPLGPRRFAIMHVFLPTPQGLTAMRDMNVLATVQDHPLLLGYNQTRWWGQERGSYAIPVRDILDAGILTGGGTDAPVVPTNPFWSLWWMTTRGTLRGDVLGPDQAITPSEALDLYTKGSAYTQFAEDAIGTLEPGKLADLVVVDGDPLSAAPDDLKDMTVDTTVVDGKVVYER